MLASKFCVNSLNSVSVGPSSTSPCLVFSKMDKIAWVAQAFLIVYKKKINPALFENLPIILIKFLVNKFKHLLNNFF